MMLITFTVNENEFEQIFFNFIVFKGFLETIATNKALENIRLLRSLVISRSTFPGTGAHGGHWTGKIADHMSVM